MATIGMMRRTTVPLLALILAVVTPPVRAVVDAAEVRRDDAVLTAYAYAAYPSGAPVRLDPRNDAGDDPALLPGFARALERRGHRVDPAAALVLSFDLVPDDDVALPGRGPAGETLVMPLGAPGARVELGSDASLHFRLSVPLGQAGDARGRPAAGDAALYRLSVELDDRRAGRRIWSADLLFAADRRGHLGVAQAMVPVLLDRLGQTVDRLGITFE